MTTSLITNNFFVLNKTWILYDEKLSKFTPNYIFQFHHYYQKFL